MGLNDLKFMIREELKVFGGHMKRREIAIIILDGTRTISEDNQVKTTKPSGILPSNLTYTAQSSTIH